MAGVEGEDLGRCGVCGLAHATAIAGAADCRRAATLTASPVTKPSPEAGSTPSRTKASPVLTPTRTSTCCPPMPGRASTSSTIRRPALTPLGVVLMQDRHAEDGDHGIPDELLDDTAVGFDRLARGQVIPAQELVHELGVVALGEGGEADEVAEERGDHAAFFGPALLALSRR